MAESVELPGRLAILPFRNKVLLPGAIIRIRCTSPRRFFCFAFHFACFWCFVCSQILILVFFLLNAVEAVELLLFVLFCFFVAVAFNRSLIVLFELDLDFTRRKFSSKRVFGLDLCQYRACF